MTKNVIITILAAIIIALLIWRPTHVETITLQGDSIPVPVPEPYEVITTQWRTAYMDNPIDTMAVIEDYFARVKYEQRLPIEKIGSVDIKFELQQNRMQQMSYSYNIQIPKTYKNTIGLAMGPGEYMPWYQYSITPRLKVSAHYLIVNQKMMVGVGWGF